MLAATITAVLLYLSVQSSGASALSAACWDERLSRAGRNGSCVAAQPFLIFGYGKAIHRMDLDGKNQRRLVSGVGSSILLDFHFKEETVYWADRNTGVIHKVAVRGARKQKLYSSEKNISGLAVDWIGNRVYWTSVEKGKIKTMDKNGKNERTLIRHLTRPSSITVDPINRFLFWLSSGTSSSIQRSDVTGRMKTTLIKTDKDLKALTIDRAGRRLFWLQFGSRGESAIASSDYRGHGLRIKEQQLHSRAVGISIFLEHLYYNDAALRGIKQINKYAGGEAVSVNIKPMAKPPVEIKVVHDLNQPTADSQNSGCDNHSESCVDVCAGLGESGTCQCSSGFTLSRQGTHCEDINECALWNHGCSLGCENIPGSYFCTCPGGYALLPDRKTCQEIVPCNGNTTSCGHGCLMTDEGSVCVCPEGSLLQDNGDGCTGCSSADRGGCSQLCIPVTPTRWQCDCLPGYQLHQDGKRCTASGPPAVLLVANLVEVRQIHPDGSSDATLVEEPRGTIIAMDYDPIEKFVYFGNQRTIERIEFDGSSREVLVSEGLDAPEGLAIDWVHRRMYWTDTSQSKVECSSLAGRNRQTILSQGLEKPRGIAVHPLAKKLFWTDVGLQPSVERASLEGDERVIIANTDLLSPSGLAIDFTEERLFWCDQRRGVVESAAMDGSDRQVLLGKQVGRPFGLAVFEDRLWISDQEQQQLRSVHKRTGKTLQLIRGNMVQPASIAVLHPLAKPGADVCLHLNGGCAHVCVSKLGLARCSCQQHHVLSADGASCLPAGGGNKTTEFGDDPATDLTFSNESRSQASTEPPIGGVNADKDFGAGSESDPFTDKMVSDQHDCSSLHCDVNAHCVLNAGTLACRCLGGFTGDGQGCVEMKMTPPTNQIADATSHENSSSTKSTVQSCPSSHKSYCLYGGVCFYYPDIESYACICVAGYMGERCQLSDLEWWDLQQSEEEKRRNVVIAASMMVLVSLLSVVACLTYCYRAKKIFHKQPSVDNVSETSVTDESVPESPSGTWKYTARESGVEAIFISVLGVPARSVSSSSSSEAGENPIPDNSGSLSKHTSSYECSAFSLDTTSIHHCSPPAYTFSTFTSFKPPLHSESPGNESPTSAPTTETP